MHQRTHQIRSEAARGMAGMRAQSERSNLAVPATDSRGPRCTRELLGGAGRTLRNICLCPEHKYRAADIDQCRARRGNSQCTHLTVYPNGARVCPRRSGEDISPTMPRVDEEEDTNGPENYKLFSNTEFGAGILF